MDSDHPVRLCEECNSLIHSLGSFTKHETRRIAKVVDEESGQAVDILHKLEMC